MGLWLITAVITFFLLIFLFAFPATDTVEEQNNTFNVVNENLKTMMLYYNKTCNFKVVPYNIESSYDNRGTIYINPNIYTDMDSITYEALIQLSSYLSTKYNKTSTTEIFAELETIYEKLKKQGKLINV